MDIQLIITIAIVAFAGTFGVGVVWKGRKAFSPKSCGNSCGCNGDSK